MWLDHGPLPAPLRLFKLAELPLLPALLYLSENDINLLQDVDLVGSTDPRQDRESIDDLHQQDIGRGQKLELLRFNSCTSDRKGEGSLIPNDLSSNRSAAGPSALNPSARDTDIMFRSEALPCRRGANTGHVLGRTSHIIVILRGNLTRDRSSGGILNQSLSYLT
jgi:hypothetical protein